LSNIGLADAYRKVLTRGEAMKDGGLLTSAYGNLGNVYQIRGDLDQAEAMYRKSLALFQEIRAAPEVKQVQELLLTLHEEGALDC
jgi:tetratricopeptide (TPR) repeat protein